MFATRIIRLCGVTAYVIGSMVFTADDAGKFLQVAICAPDIKIENMTLANVREEKKGKSLTPREKEVLAHIVNGLTNPEIAKALGCGLTTTNEHIDSILMKLDVTNRVQAAVHAVRVGLVSEQCGPLDFADQLSVREKEIVAPVVAGFSNPEIGREFGCSASVVNFHLGNIRRKFGVKNRVQVAVHAVRTGIA